MRIAKRANMWTDWHCRHCDDKHISLRPKPLKRYRFDKLLALVRSFVCNWKDNNKPISKEQVAFIFQCKTHLIEQCFNILNKEGLLGQPVHKAPHDSKRDYAFCYRKNDQHSDPKNPDGDSSWCGDRYYKRIKE